MIQFVSSLVHAGASDLVSTAASAASAITPSGIALRHSSQSRRQLSLYRASEIGERTCTFLRRIYPDRTADNVAADLSAWGIKAKTIAKMLSRRSAPGALLGVALTTTYGPAYLTAVLPQHLEWLDEANRNERTEELKREIEALRKDVEGLR